jgi:tRNA1Val (adenine37-N6)-methyltransferase
LDYFQPPNYKFTSDSIYLSRYILNILGNDRVHDDLRMLEIGCGCGVISLELAQKLPRIQFTLTEMQPVFLEYIFKNIENVIGFPYTNIDLFIQDFCNYPASDKFDIIYANLPYFYHNESRLSVDPIKNICKTISKLKLIDIISHALKLLQVNGRMILIFNKKSGKSAYNDVYRYLITRSKKVLSIERDAFLIIDYCHIEYVD